MTAMTTNPGPLEKQKRAPRFDFSALDAPTSVQTARKWAADATQQSHVELLIDDVVEDPDQPRTIFEADALASIAETIRQRRVMQPILVRERNAEGKHVIIQGARRYRGSIIAGKTTIPAIVIPNNELNVFDDYSQVIENIQRENLSAEDMCAFIVKRLRKGDGKSEIARRLGLPNKAITTHLAITEVDGDALELFRAGRIGGIETLYDFVRLRAKAPGAAAAIIARAMENPECEITLAMIRRALKDAETQASNANAAEPRSGEAPQQAASPSTLSPTASGAEARSGEAPSLQPASSGSDEAQPREAGAAANLPTLGQTTEGGNEDEDTEPQNPQKTTQQVPYHNPSAHRAAGSGDGRQPDPNHIRKPLLLGQIDGDPVKILLTRRPTSPGLVHISREDTGIEEEVALDRIKLTLLSDMKMQETA